MFVVELSLKLSPMPISVQRKELEAAQALYQEIRGARGVSFCQISLADLWIQRREI